MKSTTKIKRIPRPLGLTMIASHLHRHQKQEKNQDTLEPNIQNQLIEHIIKNNILYNNKKLTIPLLSLILNIPEESIYNTYISYQSKIANTIFNNKDNSVPQVLIFQAMAKILENEGLISQQYQLLQAAQGNSYKAFISSEVNQILLTKMRSADALINLYKTINPDKPKQPGLAFQFNQYGTSNPIESHNPEGLKSLGVNEALRLLEEEGITKLRYDENRYLSIKEEHLLNGNIPEVRANYQEGTSKDALSLLTAKPDTKATHHQKRRSQEEDLDES